MMDIKTFADLSKLADICRKKGIKQLKITQDGLEFQLGEKPTKPVRARKSDAKEAPDMVPSEEDVLFWSSAGVS